MTVYSYKMIGSLTSQVKVLAEQFFQHMPLTLTTDEFISAFVQPDHIGTLRTVEELVGSLNFRVPNVKLRAGNTRLATALSFYNSKPPIILPQYIAEGVSHECPEPVALKIESWVKQRVDYGLQFGLIYEAINELNELCGDVRGMTALMPCLPMLMGNQTDDSDSPIARRAAKLAATKSYGVLPKLPREVKDRLRDASAVVNSVSLMKEAPVPVLMKGNVWFTAVYSAHNTNNDTANIFDVTLGRGNIRAAFSL